MTNLPAVLIWGLKATPLLAAAWLVTAALRRASASGRHLVWLLAIGASLLLPLVAGVAPRIDVGFPTFGNAGPAVLAPVGPRAADAAPAEVWGGRVARAGSASSSADAGPAALASATTAVVPEARAMPVATGVWATGALLVLALLALSFWRTVRLAHGARPLRHDGVGRETERLARQLGIGRRVTVLQAADDTMPMTWGALRPQVLVPADFAAWPADRRRAVLLHELAHVRRWDWLSQLAARVACALYWWNPLVWLAARRLREERELACDDLVLTHGTAASAYAGDLLEIARRFRPATATALAGVTMARRSQLAGRLLAVLDGARPRRMVAPREAAAAVAAAVLVLLPVAGLAAGTVDPEEGSTPGVTASPAAATAGVTAALALGPSSAPSPLAHGQTQETALLCDWAAPSESNSSSTSINDDRMMIQIARDGCTLTARAEGDVTFTADDRDVARLAPRGSFEVEERTGRARRRVEVANAGGLLEHRWFVDGRVQPYGDEARAWFGDALLVLARRAGINAEARATRILERGGVNGLIAEIALLQSDYVAGKYYQVLFERADLSPAQLTRLLDDAAARIGSDHELGRVLAAIAGRRPTDPAVHRAYVRATAAIDSDHEHARALGALVDAAALDGETLDTMLASARRIGSDFERARLLLAVADRYPAGRPLPPTYLAAVGDMQSDHERGRVLEPLLARDRLAPADRARVLAVVQQIGSDHTRAQLLIAVAAGGPLEAAVRDAFFAAVNRIGSDHDRQRVLRAVVSERADEATTLAVLEAARKIGSSNAKAQVLVAVAEHGLGSDRVRAAFLSVAESIDSRYDRERVMRAAGLQGT